MIEIWTVYDRPSDYPNDFVARKYVADGNYVLASEDMFTAESLEKLRELLPLGLTCLPRNADDDPHIIETWL